MVRKEALHDDVIVVQSTRDGGRMEEVLLPPALYATKGFTGWRQSLN